MDSDEPSAFKTLRGFVRGQEPEEPEYFAYTASLRLFGESLDLEEITRELELTPTHTHRRGDKAGPASPPFTQDMWSFEPRISEKRPLAEHIDALWTSIRHAVPYLLDLKQRAQVDVFLGYRTNIDHAGVRVPYTCLEMFTQLEIPFGLSIIVT